MEREIKKEDEELKEENWHYELDKDGNLSKVDGPTPNGVDVQISSKKRVRGFEKASDKLLSDKKNNARRDKAVNALMALSVAFLLAGTVFPFTKTGQEHFGKTSSQIEASSDLQFASVEEEKVENIKKDLAGFLNVSSDLFLLQVLRDADKSGLDVNVFSTPEFAIDHLPNDNEVKKLESIENPTLGEIYQRGNSDPILLSVNDKLEDYRNYAVEILAPASLETGEREKQVIGYVNFSSLVTEMNRKNSNLLSSVQGDILTYENQKLYDYAYGYYGKYNGVKDATFKAAIETMALSEVQLNAAKKGMEDGKNYQQAKENLNIPESLSNQRDKKNLESVYMQLTVPTSEGQQVYNQYYYETVEGYMTEEELKLEIEILYEDDKITKKCGLAAVEDCSNYQKSLASQDKKIEFMLAENNEYLDTDIYNEQVLEKLKEIETNFEVPSIPDSYHELLEKEQLKDLSGSEKIYTQYFVQNIGPIKTEDLQKEVKALYGDTQGAKVALGAIVDSDFVKEKIDQNWGVKNLISKRTAVAMQSSPIQISSESEDSKGKAR